jgi:hypothetical protein
VPGYVIPPKFKKVLKKKPLPMQMAIIECVARPAENPRHPSLQTHPVRGIRGGGVFEAYVDAANRLTFHYEDGKIVLRNNCNHTIIDRDP